MGSRGRFVAIVGPDGIGKSTLAKEVCGRLGGRGAYFHFLPRPLHRLLPRPPDTAEPVEKLRHRGNRLIGIARLARNVVRSWLGYYMAIRPAMRRGTTVVGDRWIYGYLAQPYSVRFYGPEWIARLAVSLSPRPDVVVLPEASADVVLARRQELSRREIEQESQAWRVAVPMALRLDAAQPPGVLADAVVAHIGFGMRLKKYPPGLGHILLPSTPRSAALDGSSLYAPSRASRVVAHRTARALLRTIGTAWLPTAPHNELPLPSDEWAALMTSLRAGGIAVDDVAQYGRTQPERVGFSLLTIGSEGPTSFVRVAERSELDVEVRAILMLATSQPSAFSHPRLLLRGSHGTFEYVAYSAVLTGFHRPPRRPDLSCIVMEVQETLSNLPRPDGTPSHWVPMHGDFTPWNLREQRGTLVLIDWESVGWGPPHADEVLYMATSEALGLPVPAGTWSDEAAGFWMSGLERPKNARDGRLWRALDEALSRTGE